MPDVSVIVPTFNRPELLARALDSLVAQTLDHARFEVVVVNDCGLDPSSVVDAYADRLPVRLVATPENVGLAGARNAGIAASTGSFVCFLDDDDCYYPEHLELLLAEAVQLGGSTIVYSDAIKLVESEAGEPLLRHMLLAPATFSYERLLLNNYIHAMLPLVPRAALDEVGGFDETLRALEDWELWLRLGAAHPFHHVLRVTADYRVRSGAMNNTTRELPLHVRCTERVYERYAVDAGSQLARDRATYLEQHRRVADQHAFRMSVAIVGARTPGALLRAIEQAFTEHGVEHVELLAYVADDDAAADGAAWRAIAAELEGRLVVVGGARVDAAQAFEVLERAAAGERTERLEATVVEPAPPAAAEPAVATATAVDAGSAQPDRYCIRDSYVGRAVPVYYADTPSNVVWQPDVYPEARRVAEVVGARTIVDIGSGNGAKLVQLHPQFAIVGVDVGANLDFVRATHPQGTWIEHDLEQPGELPLDAALLRGSVIVCADVIEHLVRPEHLLHKLRAAFEAGAAAVLLSTPERARTWGSDHDGPPPNECHVREWSLEELGALLEREGFLHGDLELTRSNDAESRLATSFALLYRDADVEQRVRAVRDAVAAA